MDEKNLKELGREVASAMIKGQQEGMPKPTNSVPLTTLIGVAADHGVTSVSPGEFKTLAEAMQEALDEAARWHDIG